MKALRIADEIRVCDMCLSRETGFLKGFPELEDGNNIEKRHKLTRKQSSSDLLTKALFGTNRIGEQTMAKRAATGSINQPFTITAERLTGEVEDSIGLTPRQVFA